MRQAYRAELKKRALKFYNPETGEMEDSLESEEIKAVCWGEGWWAGKDASAVSLSFKITIFKLDGKDFFSTKFAEGPIKDLMPWSAMRPSNFELKSSGSYVLDYTQSFQGGLRSIQFTKTYKADVSHGFSLAEAEAEVRALCEWLMGKFIMRLHNAAIIEESFPIPLSPGGANWKSEKIFFNMQQN